MADFIGQAMRFFSRQKPEATGSLAYRKNRDDIKKGAVPEKYTRVLNLVPGQRVLELGSAEGVLALLMAERKEKVIGLEIKADRHEEALRLQSLWARQGKDVSRCSMLLGNIKDNLHLLDEVDTVVAVRSIYYLRDDIENVFQEIGRRVPNVLLCGNGSRSRKYYAANGNPDDGLGAFNYYATLEGMEALLRKCGYEIAHQIPDGDPIVIGTKHNV